MLNALRIRSPLAGGGAVKARMPNGARNELWPDLRRADLADTVRRICTMCGWTGATEVAKTMAVTSVVEREGKSSIARAIAISMANDHAGDVLLVECDLLHPSLAGDFGIEAAPGLSDVLAEDMLLSDAVHPSGLPNLWLLPAGSPSANPSRLLRSPAMQSMLEDVSGWYSYVVLDLPAVLKSSDASVIAQLAGGVVLVVRADSTEHQAAQEAVRLLSGANLHGAVVTRTKSALPSLVRRVISD